jgi:hypothetical protein
LLKLIKSVRFIEIFEKFSNKKYVKKLDLETLMFVKTDHENLDCTNGRKFSEVKMR